jgi:glycosyltransferase involved in cell wall biosynthesis
VTVSADRILHVFQPQRGGVSAYAADIAIELQARGWPIAVACDPGADVVPRLEAAGIEPHELRASRSPAPSDARSLAQLRAIVRRTDPALIHAHSTKAGMLAGVVGRTSGVPTVYTPHGWSFEMQVPRPLRLALAGYESVLARGAHRRVVAVCAAERDAGLRWHIAGPSRLEVVRTGRSVAAGRLSRGEARRALGIDEHAKVAAWLGRAGAQKRSADLPQLAAELRSRGVTLAALGGGLEDEGTSSAIRANGGSTLPEDPPQPGLLLAAADCLVQTSAWEGLPLVVIEALEYGLPVIAYSVGGVPEQVIPGENGELVPVGAIEQLAELTGAILGDEARATRLGLASRRRWVEQYQPAMMVDRLELIYRSVLDR